jgi:hypothetical protein
MEAALAEVEFLVRSENRVQALQVLAEETQTRGELGETVEASQATLGRILEDFRERSWIRRTDGEYVATATGRLVASAVTGLLDTVTTERKLREIVAYLPTAAITFDLDCLADATITTPSPTKPSAPLERVLDQMGTAAELRAVSHTFNERSLAVVADVVGAGTQTFRGVFGAETIEALAADERSWELLTDLAAREAAELHVHDGDVPMAATIGNGKTTLLLRDGDGLVQATVESTDPTVREWAIEAFEMYQAQSIPFKPADYQN